MKRLATPMGTPGALRRRERARIRIGLTQRLLINIFTICDGINALTDRRHFADHPYAYGPYLARTGASTFSEKMRVIWAAKQDKTRKIIHAKKRFGRVPAHYEHVCRKTPCGVLRLWAAHLDDGR